MNMSSRIGHASPELPAVDERLVAPESGYEIDDGKLVRVPPSQEPHANLHSKLTALLEAHVADDFDVAVDMLTRISETSDRAPDASVYPRARDPKTGGRQLEHLAFEVVSTESLGYAAGKAADLSGRGVRRVFALDVSRARAFEWSSDLGTWGLMDPGSRIEDPTLAVPLPLEALVSAAKADDAVAKALLAKRNPVLVAAVAEGRAEGRAQGRVEDILVVLAHRGLEPRVGERERILGERDLEVLERWLKRAISCSTVADLFERD
jgi:hypothetical protein